MPKLTVRTIEATKASADGDVFVWDDEMPGFGLRVKASGVKSFLIQYRVGRRTRRFTIGQYDKWKPEAARREARKLFGRVADGKDPSLERRIAAKAETVADLAARFLAEHVAHHVKPRTADEYRRLLNKVAIPEIGRLRTTDVVRTDIERLHRKWGTDGVKDGKARKGTPTDANRLLACLKVMFNFAERIGVRPDGSNPSRHVKRFGEAKRERYLTADELRVLGETLKKVQRERTETDAAAAALRLLVLTGCRLSEILTLQWAHVDFEGQCLRLPDSKTGAKVVHLNAPALSVLATTKRDEKNPYVIRGRRPASHLIDLEKPWQRIRARATVALWSAADGRAAGLVAKLTRKLNRTPTYDECRAAAKDARVDLPVGLSDVRIHDLRHSFASIAAGLGEGLPIIGKLLGHTQATTTARYAHLAADPVKAATEKVGAALVGMMSGKSAEIREIRPGAAGRTRRRPPAA